MAQVLLWMVDGFLGIATKVAEGLLAITITKMTVVTFLVVRCTTFFSRDGESGRPLPFSLLLAVCLGGSLWDWNHDPGECHYGRFED